MNARNRSYRLTTIFAITLLMSGCVVPMYPGSNPTKLLGEIEKLDRKSVEVQLNECREKEDENAKVNCRNKVIHKLMVYVDQGFMKFQSRLQMENQNRKVWLDWANLGLSTASSVVSGVRSKTNLGTASTLVQGGEPILDEHGLQGQAMNAIVRQMDSNRASVRQEIFDELQTTSEQYPLFEALSDVTRYYYAGSLPTALSELSAAASKKARNSKDAADESEQAFKKSLLQPSKPATK